MNREAADDGAGDRRRIDAAAGVAGVSEPAAVAERYARRQAGDRYHPLAPAVWRMVEERRRALLRRLAAQNFGRLEERRAIEIGCGSGGNLLELIGLGFDPGNLAGIELLPERFEQARGRLPRSVDLRLGDASAIGELPQADLVLMFTLLSSLLDAGFQRRIADIAWGWTRPGGAVLVYDFTLNNPANRDVRGVPRTRLRELFPGARIVADRVTLAPPLARALCRVSDRLYPLANALPLLRTHVLAWIEKPSR